MYPPPIYRGDEMADIRSKVYEIYSLEQLSSGVSGVHAIHPLVKMLSTVVYILCIVSFDRYALPRLVPYIFYPVIIMACADIPYGMIGRRTLIALPFCLFAGISNLIFDKMPILSLGNIVISYGMVSFLTILFRTILCVSAVLILVAITPFAELTGELRRLRVPDMIVSLFEMIYRYIGTLLSEASSMFTAYQLRSRNKKGLEMKHMGSFVGQLLIRSFDRAERIYHAMKCRGYPGLKLTFAKRRFTVPDICFFVFVCGSSILFRVVDVMGLFSNWLGGIL